jgi:hypothetical protein
LQEGNQQQNRNTANGQSHVESPAPAAVADEQSAKERAEGGSDADHAKRGTHVGTSLAERHQVAHEISQRTPTPAPPMPWIARPPIIAAMLVALHIALLVSTDSELHEMEWLPGQVLRKQQLTRHKHRSQS